MREARNWSQEELAALVNMPQTAISRLESPNYGKPTITTLKRMARVYDVGLDVRFVPFSLLADRMSKTPRMDTGLTSDSVDVPSFEEEEEQGAFESVLSIEQIPAASQVAMQFQIQDVNVYGVNAGLVAGNNFGAISGNCYVRVLTGDIGAAPYQYIYNTEPLTGKIEEFMKKTSRSEIPIFHPILATQTERRTGTYD